MAYKTKRKWINLGTAVFDFIMAVSMMVIALTQHNGFAFLFGVIFVGMGVFFLRYFERQRRLEKMTDEERLAFLSSPEARFMPKESEEITRQNRDARGDVTGNTGK